MIETFEDIKGELEAVNRRTDHAMAKRKRASNDLQNIKQIE